MRNKKYSDIMLSIGEIFKFNIKENKMNKNIVMGTILIMIQLLMKK